MKRSKKVPHVLIENEQERKERLKYTKSMVTKVVPNKKFKTRAQQKELDRREVR